MKPLEEFTIAELLEEIEASKYMCEAGPLENDLAYIEIKTRALYEEWNPSK